MSDLPAAMAKVVKSADGVPVSYEVHGTGAAALVFVHGWSCDRTYWAGQVEPLSREFQVVILDLAGHGESGLGREAWTIEAFGADVAAVVEGLGPKQIILIGHSMGGDVIVEAARRLPGRIAGLVWVDVYNRLGTPMTPEEVQAMVSRFRASFVETTHTFVRRMFPPGSDESLVDRVAADMSAAPPAIALGAMESVKTFEGKVTGLLQEIGLHVIAINPDDPPTDLESMRRYGVDVVTMPGVGHFLMMEDADGFNVLLRQTIGKLLR